MQVGDSLRRAAPRSKSERVPADLKEHRRLGREWAHDAGARWLIGADAAIRRAAFAISRRLSRA